MFRGLSPKLPLSKNATDGYTLNKDHVEMITQNLKMLILTSPGERIMEPLFGVGLRNFLFLQATENTYDTIRSQVREQVAMYMPFVEVVSVEINSDTQNISSAVGINISLEFKILPLDIFSEVRISVSN